MSTVTWFANGGKQAAECGVIRHCQRMLKTERLLLRQWTQEDELPFSAMCRDKDVMEFFPTLLAESESHEMARKISALIHSRGWGFWAIEIPKQEKIIGFAGLHTPKNSMPFSPCVEVGWRLSKHHWGKGYATEAAIESLSYAFTKLDLTEVVSFTTLANMRSQGVMQKIGMSNSGNNFMHPDIKPSHPQCEHLLYKISKSEWERNTL